MLKAGDEIFLGNRNEIPPNLWDERTFSVVENLKGISEPLAIQVPLAQMLHKMQPIVIDNSEDEGDNGKDDVDDNNCYDSNVVEMYINADHNQNEAFHQESSFLHTPDNSPISVNSSNEYTSSEKQTASSDQCIASRRFVFVSIASLNPKQREAEKV